MNGSNRPTLEACGGYGNHQVERALDGAGSEDHSRAPEDILGCLPCLLALESEGKVCHIWAIGPMHKDVHVCKGARLACAKALTITLQEVHKTPHSKIIVPYLDPLECECLSNWTKSIVNLPWLNVNKPRIFIIAQLCESFVYGFQLSCVDLNMR